MNYEQVSVVKELATRVIKVLEGLEFIEYLKKQKGGIVTSWKWQPKWGDYFINKFDDSICIFLTDRDEFMDYLLPNGNSQLMHKADFKHYAIPILEWEECFEVLVKAGYSGEMNYSAGQKDFCTIRRLGLTSTDFGSSPTEATYKAIIKLRKGKEND